MSLFNETYLGYKFIKIDNLTPLFTLTDQTVKDDKPLTHLE